MTRIVTLFFVLLSVLGCKQEASNPLTKVELLQPDLVASKCYRYRYQAGRWVLKDEQSIQSCDLIFGVSWGDYETLVREFNRQCGGNK